MGTHDIIELIRQKVHHAHQQFAARKQPYAPQINILDLLADLREREDYPQYFKVQDALDELASQGMVLTRNRGLVLFTRDILI